MPHISILKKYLVKCQIILTSRLHKNSVHEVADAIFAKWKSRSYKHFAFVLAVLYL